MMGQGPILHSQDVLEISLSQSSSPVGRQLSIVDKNRDLFLAKTIRPEFKKLGNNIFINEK